MKYLVVDTRNGIAGDIFNAGLIGLGADEERMISAMKSIAEYLGEAEMGLIKKYHTFQLKIDLKCEDDHLSLSKISRFLDKNMKSMDIEKYYRNIVMNSLNVLSEAERYVHSQAGVMDGAHVSKHHHKKHGDVVLHEAKDIMIDLIGLGMGLQELEIEKVYYLDYVNVGNGIVEFSHGIFEIPAPATRYILDKYGINWKKSNVLGELTTPTGASFLVGCDVERLFSLRDRRVKSKVSARGTREYSLPVSFYLVE